MHNISASILMHTSHYIHHSTNMSALQKKRLIGVLAHILQNDVVPNNNKTQSAYASYYAPLHFCLVAK